LIDLPKPLDKKLVVDPINAFFHLQSEKIIMSNRYNLTSVHLTAVSNLLTLDQVINFPDHGSFRFSLIAIVPCPSIWCFLYRRRRLRWRDGSS
jgi:hypothetical protein